MNLKTLTILILLFLNSQNIYAKKSSQADFLLQANEQTSFMHYEFHQLAYEAALKKDLKNAHRIYLKLANKGDDRAEYNIGMMYMKGLGVDRGKMDAYKWLRRASKHGNKEATSYFQKMNERYTKKVPKPRPKAKKKKLPKPVVKISLVEKNSSNTSINKVQAPINTIMTETKKDTDSFGLLYIIIAFISFIFVLAFFFFKKATKEDTQNEVIEKKIPQNSTMYKAQVYDITYAHVNDYHTALLQQIDMSQIKEDKNKLKIYYMFVYGMIDYYCQLEKLSDTQQRRLFSNHMGELAGKENITSITQSILEGQRDSTMYHYQAAGGISAQAWHEHKAIDALSMLTKLLTEDRP